MLHSCATSLPFLVSDTVDRAAVVLGAFAFDQAALFQLQDLVRDRRLRQHHPADQIADACLLVFHQNDQHPRVVQIDAVFPEIGITDQEHPRADAMDEKGNTFVERR